MSKERIKELTILLNKYAAEYYENDAPSISDAAYDVMYDELRKLEEKENEKVIEIVTNASGENKNASRKKEKKEKKKKGKTAKNKKETSKKSKDSDWERIKNTYGVKK